MKVKVGISNRHVHLTKEVKNILFGDIELTKRNDLSQIGECAYNETIILKTDKDQITNVRILGPLRNYTQVEITKTDAYKLGINPPVRNSGNLSGSESITLVGPKGEYYLKEGVIIATRHIHMSPLESETYMYENNQKVKVEINSEKSGIIENVYIKIKEGYSLELHLDTDDANAFLLNNGDEADVL